MFLSWLTKTVLLWIAQLSVFFLAPVAALLANKDTGRLPSYLKWMETFDVLGWDGPLSEPAVAKIFNKYEKRVAMTVWLWRNKAYTLREKWRVPRNEEFVVQHRGTILPAKKGYSYLYVTVETEGKTYFEFQPRVGFGSFMLYLRVGWKLQPYVYDENAYKYPSTGIFQGLTPRSDDWDDWE